MFSKTGAVAAAVATAMAVAVVPLLAAQAATTPATVTKVLTIVEENHSLAQMQSGMPYAFSQATKYGYATSWAAITHPSLPNYIAIASGQTYGISDDNAPSSHPLSGSSVFGQAVAAGKTAKVYAEGETSNCMLSNTGKYAVKHNPWAYFTGERTACGKYDVPVTALAGDITAGTLPNVGMVVPDLCNDAHDCSLATADTWFQSLMAKIYAGPDWQSGNLAVVLTADEDDSKSGNKVLTVVMHPAVSGKVVSTALTHYSLTRFYEDVAGVSHLNGAASAPDMGTAFGLVPSPAGGTPTPTPTVTPTVTPTPTPTVTPTTTPTSKPTVTPTTTPTSTPTVTPTTTPTTTPTPPPTSSGGSTITVTASADAFTEQDTAATNYGSWPRWSGDASSSKQRHAYLRFNVALPAGQQVASATLKAYSESASTGAGVSVYKTAATWAEGGITWNNEPARGALVTTKGNYPTGSYVPFDVTSGVPAAGGQVDFRLESNQAAWLGFHSRENTAKLPPQLVITTTPTQTSTAPPSATPTPTVTPTQSPTVTPTQAPTAAPAPPSSGTGEAATTLGWGAPIAGDEFNYTGLPDSTKWNLYNSAGQAGKGLRRSSAWNVDGAAATVTGDSAGTTGGMSAKFGRQKYGRWEVRMRTNVRDPKYHPVLILWPDVSTSTCPEVDYAEGTSDTTLMHFYLHYGCGGVQTSGSKAIDTTQWHNYAVEWTPTGITGYIDGVQAFRDTDTAHLPSGSMHQTVQLDWFPDGTATKVSTMSVDWVRVYK